MIGNFRIIIAAVNQQMVSYEIQDSSACCILLGWKLLQTYHGILTMNLVSC